MDLPQLFRAGYTSQSSDELAKVTQMIQSFYPNPNFYEECFKIISDHQNEANIRKSALISLKNGILECWKNSFSNELKNFILSNLPEVISVSSIDLLPLFEKTCDKIVNLTLFNNEWPSLFSQNSSILPQLYQQDIGHLRAGLILTKSISKLIRNPDKNRMAFFQAFSSFAFPMLANAIQQCNDTLCLTYMYHILARLLLNTLETVISTFPEAKSLINVYYIKFMQFASNMPSPITEEHINFMKKGIKFLTRITKIMDNEQILAIFNLLKTIFALPVKTP